MRENFSGAQKNIYRLLINLNRKEVYPILLGQAESPLTNLTEKKGINTMIVPFPPGLQIYDQKILSFNLHTIIRFVKGVFLYNKQLVKECKELKPEIIWCDNIRTLITIYLACRIMKVKIIWNIWSEPQGKVAWIVHRLGLFLADCINIEYKNQSKKIFGRLENFSFVNKKIVPLYTGVSDFEELTGKDIRKELTLDPNDILIIMASNIVPGKGQIDLIKSFENIIVQSTNVHLLLAGIAVESSPISINYYNEINEYLIKNNLSQKIHLIGWRSDIRDILAMSDIYVSTSYSESFPDAVREAMLASLPVIVTNVGGTSELVDIGKNGYLFEPGDIKSLTRYIQGLISNPLLRKDMGKYSKTIIEERFSTKVYAKNFEIMIKNTLMH